MNPPHKAITVILLVWCVKVCNKYTISRDLLIHTFEIFIFDCLYNFTFSEILILICPLLKMSQIYEN